MPQRIYKTKEEAKEANRIKTAEWRKNNPEAIKEHTRRYREKHKEYFDAYRKQWAIDNHEKVLETAKRQYDEATATPELRAEFNKKHWDYRNNSPEALDAYRKYQREYHKKRRARLKQERQG